MVYSYGVIIYIFWNTTVFAKRARMKGGNKLLLQGPESNFLPPA